jgi:hypothetical protein
MKDICGADSGMKLRIRGTGRRRGKDRSLVVLGKEGSKHVLISFMQRHKCEEQNYYINHC